MLKGFTVSTMLALLALAVVLALPSFPIVGQPTGDAGIERRLSYSEGQFAGFGPHLAEIDNKISRLTERQATIEANYAHLQ